MLRWIELLLWFGKRKNGFPLKSGKPDHRLLMGELLFKINLLLKESRHVRSELREQLCIFIQYHLLLDIPIMQAAVFCCIGMQCETLLNLQWD